MAGLAGAAPSCGSLAGLAGLGFGLALAGLGLARLMFMDYHAYSAYLAPLARLFGLGLDSRVHENFVTSCNLNILVKSTRSQMETLQES